MKFAVRLVMAMVPAVYGVWVFGAEVAGGWAGALGVVAVWLALLLWMAWQSGEEMRREEEKAAREEAAETLRVTVEALRQDAALRSIDLGKGDGVPQLLGAVPDYETALAVVLADPRPPWVVELIGERALLATVEEE